MIAVIKHKLRWVFSFFFSLPPSPWGLLWYGLLSLYHLDGRAVGRGNHHNGGLDSLHDVCWRPLDGLLAGRALGLFIAHLLVAFVLVLLEHAAHAAKGLAQEAVHDHNRTPNNVTNLGEQGVWEQANGNGPRHTQDGQYEGDGPLCAADAARDDREGLAANKDDGHLETNHEKVDDDEELVPL